MQKILEQNKVGRVQANILRWGIKISLLLLIFAGCYTCFVLKPLLPILLAVVIFLQPLGKLWIVASFELNRDYIAQTLCEARDEVANTCQGVCQLKKQLAEAEEQEQQQQSSLKKSLELVYVMPHISLGVACLPSFVARLPLHTPYQAMKARLWAVAIFRPPIC